VLEINVAPPDTKAKAKLGDLGGAALALSPPDFWKPIADDIGPNAG
jgi:hypothetical protein